MKQRSRGLWCRPVTAAVGIVVVVALIAVGHLSAQEPRYPGFRVVGRHLYDRLGDQFIPYGVNKMVIWTDRDGLPAYEEIAQIGANAVRIVWLTEGTAEELDTAIINAVAHRLVPIIDCHDSTGEWSKLETCVDYWVRPDIAAVLKEHEEYLLVNIANEAGEGVVPGAEFRAAYELAIRRMRAAGIHVPLIIDAQGYGQDIDDLQLNAPYLIKADPDQNLMFSIHMWWPSAWRGDNVDQMVVDEIAESVAMDLPLIIGEFAHKAVGCTCCIPYETIIREAYENEIGYLAWSWGPGNNDCEEMDMTEDGTFETLHGWGREVALTSPYSIQNIAVRPDWIVAATPVPTTTPAPAPAPSTDLLLSLDQPTTASTAESADLTPDLAVDGDITTRWSSAWTDDEWIQVDLGAVHPIRRIILGWETAYAEEYQLQVSDDEESWETAVHVADGNGGWDDHEVVTEGRYVRMQGIRRATEYGYSLWEFWVFEEANVDLSRVAPIRDEFIEGEGATPAFDARPDLVVTDISWTPSPIYPGVPVRFQATIENRGGSATHMDPPVHLGWQIEGETVAWTEITEPLAPGASMTVVADESQAGDGAWYPAEPREFVVLAWVDDQGPPAGVVDEIDENNNLASTYGTVQEAQPTAAPAALPTATPTDVPVGDATPVPPPSVTPTPPVDLEPETTRAWLLLPIAGIILVGLFAFLIVTGRNQ